MRSNIKKNLNTLLLLLAFLTPHSAMAQRWNIELGQWTDDNLHWTAPSSVTLHDDGYVTIRAKHLANMRRTSAIFDAGSNMCTHVSLTFYSDKECAGPALNTQQFLFTCLDYKRELFDVEMRRGGGKELATLFERAQCVIATKIWKSPFQ